MKKILRSIFVSPEIYVFGVSILLSYIFDDFYKSINNLVFPIFSTEIPYVTIGAIFALTITPTIIVTLKMIFPEENYKKYMEWDGYKQIVFICRYSIVYQFVGLIIFILMIVIKDDFYDYYKYTISIYISLLVSLATVANGYINLRIILRRNEK